MSKKRMVIALGHKDLGFTLPEQKAAVARTATMIGDFVEDGYQVALVFSNAPQVGMIHTAMKNLTESNPEQYVNTPLHVCSAMSQGMIGYHIQQGLSKVLRHRGINKNVVTIVTQVVVDKDDPKFKAPSKPIGPFYTEEEAKAIAAEKGYTMKEDAGRGWRRVVASPLPVEIVELDAVKTLNDAGFVVVTVGGGGIPVVRNEAGDLEGVAAVIDKDLASEKLARDMDADALVILTAVEKVSINFKKPDQKDLDRMSAAEAKQYIKEGHFAPGSMLPKIEAALNFVESKPGRIAIITSLDKAVDAIEGRAGTTITE